MKKITALLLSLSLIILVACSTTDVKPATFDIASLKGPTSMGLVSLMENSSIEGHYKNTYNVTIHGTADEFVAAFSKGEINVANIPSNLASVLYNRTGGKIKLLGINTLGVLYVISTGNVSSVKDLAGKTIYTTGKGTTPEHVLNYVLSKNGIDPNKDVNIEYLSEATEVAAKLSSGVTDAVALLPQPYVTVVLTKNQSYKISLDMNKEWEAVSGGTPIVTGVIAINSDFYDNNKAAVNQFMDDYAKSVEFVNADPAAAAQLVEKYGIINAAVAEKAIPLCNIVLISKEKMQQAVSAYLNVLYSANPDSIGGTLPNEDFYIK